MERVETSKFTRNMTEHLAKIEAGEQIMLTRYGRDVALVSSPLHGQQTSLPANESAAKQSARDELLNKMRRR